MNPPFNWECPYCNRFCVVTDANFFTSRTTLDKGQEGPVRIIRLDFIVCANPDCRRFTFQVVMVRPAGRSETMQEEPEQAWTLLPPPGSGRKLDGVPAAILTDFQEAVRIVALSPRCASVLARQCFQKAIMDFYKPPKLPMEKIPELLKARLHPYTWEAIANLLQANPELNQWVKKGVTTAAEVSLENAEAVIRLTELFLKETYVSKFEKARQLRPNKES
jgi:hypothetical protein